MRAIIAGGRGYRLTVHDYNWLDSVHAKMKITEVVSGGAPGADTGGEIWAEGWGIPIRRFPAQWGEFGKRAGPIRNREMAEHVGQHGLCILFPGGKGTANMREEANSVGVRVIEAGEDLE